MVSGANHALSQMTERSRDCTYSGDGTPLVFVGLGGVAVAFLIGIAGVVLARAAGSYLIGCLSTILALSVGSVAVRQILRTPTKLHLREREIGFTFLNGKTLWVPRSSVSARIAIIGSDEGWRMLRFDTPYSGSFVPVAYDPTTLVGEDGLLLETRDLERALGMRVQSPLDRS